MPPVVCSFAQQYCTAEALTVCQPWAVRQIALYGTGLGSKLSSCLVMSGSDNRGDGVTVRSTAAQTAEERATHVSGGSPRYEVSSAVGLWS